MTVLAIDTTQEFGSLALNFGSETIAEVPLHAPEGYSAILFNRIQKLLQENNLTLALIDIFAAGAGPGSFTGVRVGLSCVKALAEAGAKACFGISNLAAMASFGAASESAVILDARRGEVYASYSGRETVAPLPAWLDSLPPNVAEFLAFDFLPFAPALSASRFASAARTVVPRAIASAIAELALERFRLGDSGDPALADANYVRRSDAELLWKGR